MNSIQNQIVCPSPTCRGINLHNAVFCRECGNEVSNLSAQSNSSRAVTQYSDSRNDQLALQNYSLELGSAANQLVDLRTEFSHLRANLNQGSFLWRVLFRHRDAAELQDRFNAVSTQIEDIYSNLFVQLHQQRSDAALKRQQQQLDFQIRYEEFLFNQRLKTERILGMLDRLAAATDRLYLRFRDEGRFDELKDSMIQELLLGYLHQLEQLIFTFKDEIFDTYDDNDDDDDDDNGYNDPNSLDYLEDY